MIVNGVTLPDIPAEVKLTRPYAAVLKMIPSGTGVDIYMLMTSVSIMGRVSSENMEIDDYDELFGSLGSGKVYYSIAGGTEWFDESEEIAAGGLMLPLGTYSETNTEGTSVEYTISVVWANHNIYDITAIDTTTGAYTRGEIWFPISLKWPELPEGVFNKYPHGAIFFFYAPTGEAGFYLCAAADKFDHLPNSLTGMGVDLVVGRTAGFTSYRCGVDATEWTLFEEDEDSAYASGFEGLCDLGDEYKVFGTLTWANHDIYTASAVNEETETITPGKVLFYDCPEDYMEGVTDDEERYSISADILNDIARAIQKQRKTTRQYKPEEFAFQILSMLVLPGAEAVTTISVVAPTAAASGSVPTVSKGRASTTYSGFYAEITATGFLPADNRGTATTTLAGIALTASASGLTE